MNISILIVIIVIIILFIIFSSFLLFKDKFTGSSFSTNLYSLNTLHEIYICNKPLFYEIVKVEQDMFKDYLYQSLNAINLITSDINSDVRYIIIGDVHGSLIQLFSPLVKYGFINNINYDFKNNKFTFNYLNYINNNTKIIYVGDVISRSCHAYGFPMMEALIEIEQHFNFENVIYLNGNHEIGFMLYTGNSYGLYDYEFDEYVMIYENGLVNKDKILNEKRKIIYNHIKNSKYPLMYNFSFNTNLVKYNFNFNVDNDNVNKNVIPLFNKYENYKDIIVSHTIIYEKDISKDIKNNLHPDSNISSQVEYLNKFVKNILIDGTDDKKQDLFINMYCKRPSGDYGLQEFLNSGISKGQTINNSKLLLQT